MAGPPPSEAAGRGDLAALSGGLGGKLELECPDLALSSACSSGRLRLGGRGDTRCLRWQRLEQNPLKTGKATRSHPGLLQSGPSPGGESPRSARTYTQPSRHRYNVRRRIAMTIVHCCCRQCLLAGCLRIVIVAFIGGRVWRCAATPPPTC